MKKLIAIAVVFALVAGAAFAETSVSGTIDTRLVFIDANSDKDANDDPIPGTIHGSVADGYVQLSGQDDDGVIGGLVRIRANENSPAGANDYNAGQGDFHRAYVWWKPIPQLNIFLGQDLDGKFGTDPLTAWGFHQGGENFLNRHDWDFWRMVFPGNWDGFGFSLSVFPAPGVSINVVVPTGIPEYFSGRPSLAGYSLSWENVLDSLRLQSEIGIPDIGKIFISWIGGRQNLIDSDAAEGVVNYGQIGASFLLTAVDGLQAQLGLSTYLLNADNTPDDYNAPLAIGAAVHYVGGDWGIKFRSAFVLGTVAAFNTTADTWKYRAWVQGHNFGTFSEGTLVTFNVMPWFNAGILRAFFDIGADIGAPKDADDPIVYFWINPYIRKSIGPGAINAGIRVEIDAPNPDDDPRITFQIPVQFVFSF